MLRVKRGILIFNALLTTTVEGFVVELAFPLSSYRVVASVLEISHLYIRMKNTTEGKEEQDDKAEQI